MKENEVLYDLDAVTICMFANWNPMNFSPEGDQCMFSYAVPGSHNELTLFTYLNLRILIHGREEEEGFIWFLFPLSLQKSFITIKLYHSFSKHPPHGFEKVPWDIFL